MRDLLILLDQIQPFLHDRVVLVPIFPRLEQYLDHVLHPLLDIPLVQDRSEPLKNEVVGLGRVLREEGANLSRKGAGDLDGVGGGVLEEEKEDLEGDELVSDGLVDEMGDEGGGGEADGLKHEARPTDEQQGKYKLLMHDLNDSHASRVMEKTRDEKREARNETNLVVPLERPPKLRDEPGQDELSDLRKLGVDDGDEGGKDGREGQGGCLGFHDRPRKETSSSDEVLAKQLGDDVLDVRYVDLYPSTFQVKSNKNEGRRERRERKEDGVVFS
jgi:hypothetical protein